MLASYSPQFVGSSAVITTFAGNGSPGYSGDGRPATDATLSSPSGIAVDGVGDLFIADPGNSRIREVNVATGVMTTVAGDGTFGFSGDGGPATAAELSFPGGVAVDFAGDIFIGDSVNCRIREVNHSTGIITTVAGNGIAGFSGDGGPATAAELDWPSGVAVDAAGDIFFADLDNDLIREVNHSTGIITTVAGHPLYGLGGDGGPATAAELSLPGGVAVDAAGDIFIADTYDDRIREVNHSTGIITTVAGNGQVGYGSDGDGGPAIAAPLYRPEGLALDSVGNLFISDTEGQRIREVNHSTGIITTVAGNGIRVTAATAALPPAPNCKIPGVLRWTPAEISSLPISRTTASVGSPLICPSP